MWENDCEVMVSKWHCRVIYSVPLQSRWWPDFDSSADSELLHAVLKYIRSLDKCPINTSDAVQHHKGLNTKPEAICSLVDLILENPK